MIQILTKQDNAQYCDWYSQCSALTCWHNKRLLSKHERSLLVRAIEPTPC